MASYFKFPLDKKTEEKIENLISEIKQAENPKKFNRELADIVNKLIDEGMDYYFINTLRRLKINAIVRKPFEIGINTSIKGLKVVSPKIFKTLSEKQFKEAVEILEEMIVKEK